MKLRPLLIFFYPAMLVVSQGTNGTTGALGDARPVRNNPVIGETWIANFDSPAVQGTVTAVASTIGINYTVEVTGLAVEQGPYSNYF